jgi:hypothetical protein
MTPLNIAGMAHVKGLSLISLTDHNTGGNLKAMSAAAEKYGLIFVPGIEVTTREEVHVLTYFADIERAVRFGEMVYGSLPDISNRPDIFGEQIIVDGNDVRSGVLERLLLQASAFSIDDIVRLAREAGGGAVPAHINRDSFSVLSNLGFIPENLFSCVETAGGLPCPAIDPAYKILRSSDAHELGDILEPLNMLCGISCADDFISYISNM